MLSGWRFRGDGDGGSALEGDALKAGLWLGYDGCVFVGDCFALQLFHWLRINPRPRTFQHSFD
ncbi:hypothetical protein ILYODFUR_001948, partial [Ilyodon furcidens]|nr:hypothetical protein [Ataeniobius toweri]